MMANGKMDKSKVEEFISSKMEICMKDTLKMIKEMEEEYILGIQELSIMASGKVTHLMDKAYLFLRMVKLFRLILKAANMLLELILN